MIKPLLKQKRTKEPDLKKEGDKLYQELGRKVYSRCLVCGGDYSCLHHFVKKSQSTALRYDLENGIPICVNCHCSIHQGLNDTVVARITLINGKEWLDSLEKKKREGAGLYYGKAWYREKIEYLILLCHVSRANNSRCFSRCFFAADFVAAVRFRCRSCI